MNIWVVCVQPPGVMKLRPIQPPGLVKKDPLLPARHSLLRHVQAVEDIQAAAPGCLEAEPDLAFELHLARFHARATAGNAAGAVALSRAALTPITQRHAHLVPALKVR